MAKKQKAEAQSKAVFDLKARDKRMLKQLAHVRKVMGQESVRAIAAEYEPTPCHSTGIAKLNASLNGGIAKGRITELYGPEGGGKTTLALSIAVQAQKKGGIIHFIDAENKFDESILEILGVDRAAFQLVMPENSEEAWNELATWLDNAGPEDIAILDSLAALRSVSELQATEANTIMGLRAKMNALGLSKIKNKVAHSGCTVIIINQVRYKMGVVYGNPETTPGGDELKFASGTRLRIVPAGALEDHVGHICRIYATKCNHARPYQKVEIPLIYGEGFDLDNIVELFEQALACGVVVRKNPNGNIYLYWDRQINGRNNFIKQMRGNEELRKWIQDAIAAQLKSQA